ncbi:MAG: putative holin-like toxin [Clostridium sp.]|nr:putative holin-like toxin [Clostridium sp.]
MTAYEIVSIFIGILALLMSFGSLIVALLAFFDKKNNKRK